VPFTWDARAKALRKKKDTSPPPTPSPLGGEKKVMHRVALCTKIFIKLLLRSCKKTAEGLSPVRQKNIPE